MSINRKHISKRQRYALKLLYWGVDDNDTTTQKCTNRFSRTLKNIFQVKKNYAIETDTIKITNLTCSMSSIVRVSICRLEDFTLTRDLLTITSFRRFYVVSIRWDEQKKFSSELACNRQRIYMENLSPVIKNTATESMCYHMWQGKVWTKGKYDKIMNSNHFFFSKT